MKMLLHLIKANRVMLVNAGSLVGTTAVTTSLGFVYWWLAAREFLPQAVGLSSAAISAMTLLGNLCILGLGTLLIGELPRHPGRETSLISAALILVGGVGGCAGIVFALVAPFISASFQPLRASFQEIVFFAASVSLTSITIVLDQAFIGLLRGELQLWRNTLFAGAKLLALFAAAFWLSHTIGLAIYATWTVGNVVSLVVLAGFAIAKGKWSRDVQFPQWGLLRKLGPMALQHHIFNLILEAPSLILPVLVTILLSTTANAWFFVSFMLANFGFLVCFALTTVLYATSSAQPANLAHHARLTLGLATAACLLATCVLLLGTKQILGLFGLTYAEHAAWSLRILCFGAFPLIIKDHYVAISRIQGRIVKALPLIATGLLIESSMAALGAHIGGLPGLSLGWDVGVSIEALFMFRTVYKVIQPTGTKTARVGLQHYVVYPKVTDHHEAAKESDLRQQK